MQITPTHEDVQSADARGSKTKHNRCAKHITPTNGDVQSADAQCAILNTPRSARSDHTGKQSCNGAVLLATHADKPKHHGDRNERGNMVLNAAHRGVLPASLPALPDDE